MIMMLSLMLWQLLFASFAIKRCQGVVQFTTQPANKTVHYGDFVEFECRVNDQNHLLNIYIGRTDILTEGNKFSHLDSREFFANTSVNGTLGRVWFLINNRTIQLFDKFWCRVSLFGLQQHLDSEVAYIDVKYPECSAQQSLDNIVQSTMQGAVQPTMYTSTTPQDFQPACNCDSMIKEVDNPGQAVFYYQIAFGICLSLVIVMFLILVIIVARLCITHRIQIREKSSQNSASRICDSLVRNPIYAGPVYETVQPRFETLVTTTAQKSTMISSSTSDSASEHDQSLLLSDTTDDISRYVSKPSRSASIPTQSEEPSPYIYPQDHHQSREDRSREGLVSTGEYTPAAKEVAKKSSFDDKEDPYTVMSPAGTLTASFKFTDQN